MAPETAERTGAPGRAGPRRDGRQLFRRLGPSRRRAPLPLTGRSSNIKALRLPTFLRAAAGRTRLRHTPTSSARRVEQRTRITATWRGRNMRMISTFDSLARINGATRRFAAALPLERCGAWPGMAWAWQPWPWPPRRHRLAPSTPGRAEHLAALGLQRARREPLHLASRNCRDLPAFGPSPRSPRSPRRPTGPACRIKVASQRCCGVATLRSAGHSAGRGSLAALPRSSWSAKSPSSHD